ncbi:MAG TPA: DNA polymerase IV, partial [Sphingomicrobium sp.]|nr:DNA polymerase IV [Sphingomicrobium sp.]
NKPDGICVIPPHKGPEFVAALPVKRFHGVGPVTAAKMERLGILTGADLARWPIEELEAQFGSSGRWYWRIARGIDDREVKPDRPYKSVSAERTFDVDLSEAEDLRRELSRVAGYAWQRIERSEVQGRTVTLKVKFGDFTQITRSKSFAGPVPDFESFEAAGLALLDALMPVSKGIRLLGLGLHSIMEEGETSPRQLGLEI